MSREDDRLRIAVEKQRIPIVTLDNKWHKIWTMIEKPGSVKRDEKALNDLLRRQGKLGCELKDIKKLKKKLMDEIVSSMDETENESKVEENKRLIEECNDKSEGLEKELEGLPEKIDELNRNIMFETAECCYYCLHSNEKEINELAEWIGNIRVELKKNVVRKQEMEIQNGIIYGYMNDIFGASVADLMELKYNPMERLNQLKAIRDEQRNKKKKDKEAEKEKGQDSNSGN